MKKIITQETELYQINLEDIRDRFTNGFILAVIKYKDGDRFYFLTSEIKESKKYFWTYWGNSFIDSYSTRHDTIKEAILSLGATHTHNTVSFYDCECPLDLIKTLNILIQNDNK
jgi:hypothetical protein